MTFLNRMSHIFFPTEEDKLFAGFPDMSKLTEIRTKKKNVQCFGLSDLHADHKSSLEWIEQHCLGHSTPDENRPPSKSTTVEEAPYTVFIIPGDIGSEIANIRKVFQHLVRHYDTVCYIFGNHEAWTTGSMKKKNPRSSTGEYLLAENSLEKLREVYEVAREERVIIGPLVIEYDSEGVVPRSLFLFPMQSWYHSGFDREPEIQHPLHEKVEKILSFDHRWSDFRACKWPTKLVAAEEGRPTISRDMRKLAEAFAQLNEPYLPEDRPSNDLLPEGSLTSPLIHRYYSHHHHRFFPRGSRAGGGEGTTRRQTIISYSHFVPRPELTPEKRFLLEPNLSKVIGSDLLEQQIRRLSPDLHLFGHTHIPIDMELEGIRYLQWPLGYKREAEELCAPVVQSGPLCVFDSRLGDGKEGIPEKLPTEAAYWTEYYRNHERDTSVVTELAPWVIKRLEMFL